MINLKFSIEWTYETKKKQKIQLTSEAVSLSEALLIAMDIEQTGRVKELVFTSDDGQTWTLKELKKLQTKVKEEPSEITAYFDGGFDKGTGECGLGAVIYYTLGNKKMRVRTNEKVAELDSNNEAEYAAFSFLVSALEELGITRQTVTFKGDSQVVLNQLSGEWPCYEENFSLWLDKIERQLEKLKIRPVYIPISRKENNEADKLATQALKSIKIHSNLELSKEDENDG
ncbi:reverse transcriptase-like protein [Metabacillus fastidiosus]|uniref:reverse transcriptase-like protein n=1 Tax=Metabacillus fastidiosus TaxID=1458 RepID=UPI003D2E4D05